VSEFLQALSASTPPLDPAQALNYLFA